jgi:hypothetical protein
VFADSIRSHSSLTCRGSLSHQFTVNGKRCEAFHSLEYRKQGNVSNTLDIQTGTQGFEPQYRHSDGATHAGTDPDEATLFFSDPSAALCLSVNRSDPKRIGGALVVDRSSSPERPLWGRSIPTEAPADSPLVLSKSGRLVARFVDSKMLTHEIQCDPSHGDMIVDESVFKADHIKQHFLIREFQRFGNLWLAKRSESIEYGEANETFQRAAYSFETPVTLPSPQLWLDRLPAGLPVSSGKSELFSTDKNGHVIRARRKLHKGIVFDSSRIVQGLSLAGIFVFGGIWLLEVLKKRRKSTPKALP